MVDGDGFIICDGLVKVYRVAAREVVALQGLELRVERGETLSIVGASGSGKSTLLNIIGGLDRPTAGRIYIDGVDLGDLSDAELDRHRRERTGFVWQQPGRNLVSYLSARENVMLPMTLARIPERERRARADELLNAVGLSDRRDHIPARLSGGQQQRLAIAVSLANRPRLLLADEPTGELDTTTSKEIYDLFRALNREYGLTIIIVSHDPDIARVVDRKVTIRDGKTSTETRQVIAPADVASDAAQQEVHLEEWVVLDSAGRLQLPEEYREQFGIRDRVRVEMTEDGIMIRPAKK
jgi:ABC-type lipoprotein export system ATPase subunit